MKEAKKYPVKGELATRKGIFTYHYVIYHSKRYHADFYMFDIWDERDDPPDLHKFSFCLEIMENDADLKVLRNQLSGIPERSGQWLRNLHPVDVVLGDRQKYCRKAKSIWMGKIGSRNIVKRSSN